MRLKCVVMSSLALKKKIIRLLDHKCGRYISSFKPHPVLTNESPSWEELVLRGPDEGRLVIRLIVLPTGDLRPVHVSAQIPRIGKGHSGVDDEKVHEHKIPYLKGNPHRRWTLLVRIEALQCWPLVDAHTIELSLQCT